MHDHKKYYAPFSVPLCGCPDPPIPRALDADASPWVRSLDTLRQRQSASIEHDPHKLL